MSAHLAPPLPCRLYEESLGSDSDPIARMLIAYLDDTVVGYLFYAVSSDQLHLDSIIVHPPFRRRGVATQLLTHLIRRFPHHRIDWGDMTLAARRLRDALNTSASRPPTSPPASAPTTSVHSHITATAHHD